MVPSLTTLVSVIPYFMISQIYICHFYNLSYIEHILILILVNIVRNRTDITELKEDLTSLGADTVWTEEELRKTSDFRDRIIPKAKLALNCVGGQLSTEILKCLDKRGCHVTYGGMSLKPVISPTSALIFKVKKMVLNMLKQFTNFQVLAYFVCEIQREVLLGPHPFPGQYSTTILSLWMSIPNLFHPCLKKTFELMFLPRKDIQCIPTGVIYGMI